MMQSLLNVGGERRKSVNKLSEGHLHMENTQTRSKEDRSKPGGFNMLLLEL